MYNRYIPQADGSYRRSRVPDRPQSPQKEHKRPEPVVASGSQPEIPKETPSEPPKKTLPGNISKPQKPVEGNLGNFLKQLLPRNFDLGDMMIVLLLLIMAGDCQEDQNTAILTLALYLFM